MIPVPMAAPSGNELSGLQIHTAKAILPDMTLTTPPPPSVVTLLPGECAASRGEKTFSTLLGSCIAACIYDNRRGIGGMNHFMLPDQGSMNPLKAAYDKSARYGDYAMELLINRAMGLGAERRDLVAKLFGGAALVQHIDNDIGLRNIEFALRYLYVEKIPIVASDLGGAFARKIDFNPASGQVALKRIRNVSNTLIQREIALAHKMQEDDPCGPIIFF